MATKHSKAAKQFQRNIQRAEWHDNTLWGVRVKRDRMSRTLPEWEHLRDMASAIKKHTLSHLDTYLEQFSSNAQSNGVIVHWAADAEEFNGIVLDILKSHNVRKLVKSKSMLTEECEMNPYLEAHGINVVETDLGERIIQLMHREKNAPSVSRHSKAIPHFDATAIVYRDSYYTASEGGIEELRIYERGKKKYRAVPVEFDFQQQRIKRK